MNAKQRLKVLLTGSNAAKKAVLNKLFSTQKMPSEELRREYKFFIELGAVTQSSERAQLKQKLGEALAEDLAKLEEIEPKKLTDEQLRLLSFKYQLELEQEGKLKIYHCKKSHIYKAELID